jgi:hypothetical protein
MWEYVRQTNIIMWHRAQTEARLTGTGGLQQLRSLFEAQGLSSGAHVIDSWTRNWQFGTSVSACGASSPASQSPQTIVLHAGRLSRARHFATYGWHCLCESSRTATFGSATFCCILPSDFESQVRMLFVGISKAFLHFLLESRSPFLLEVRSRPFIFLD